MEKQRSATGGCLCSAVRYQVNTPLAGARACHCSICRKQSGHYMVGARVGDWRKIKITGEEHVTWYHASDEARRGFCAICGSHLFYFVDSGQGALLAASLDSPTGLSLLGHMFVSDKGDYYEITDGLPQSNGWQLDETNS